MAYIRGIFYSLPFQLLFLHFRKYQILLIFWFILFATVNGSFMKGFGANALYLAPEYLGNVNAIGTSLLGIAIGVFIMCWNITTFILFSRHFTFLAATQYPFLKYCINNSVIPLAFLIFYLIKGITYSYYKELMPVGEIIFLTIGFLIGLMFILLVSFAYFFSADKTILRKLQPLFNNAKDYIAHLQPEHAGTRSMVHTEWFLDSFFSIRRCRSVSHYSPQLMENIFKRHHFAAVVCFLFAYLFLIVIGFFLDYKFFQIPAAASITIFFAILIGVSGALAYFFQSWSVPVLIIFLLLLNFMYKKEWVDPRNKAYGLNYTNPSIRPEYTKAAIDSLSSDENIAKDRQNMNGILNRWKAKQEDEKPLMIVIATSGGGTRSATFTMNVLQRLDSLTKGQFLNKTVLITGASGGMIGATYFRELYRQRLSNKDINLQNPKYLNNIAGDLLNPTFSSFVARDLFAPEQKFSVGPYTYLKDRGYSFESALNANTKGALNKRLKDYKQDELKANIPMIIYHTIITRDGKKLIIGTQPLRFMMKPLKDSNVNIATQADVIDFTTFFSDVDPHNLRVLTALRMNATFPIVLPNVWLPSNPIIDVMDGGMRDNYGIENSLRFLSTMQDWIFQNTSGVLIIQIRDRLEGGWDDPYELEDMTENAVKPFFLLQNNWYKMMEYSQSDLITYFANNSTFPVHKINFQYTSAKEDNKAALNFHLTQREKRDISESMKQKNNVEGFKKVMQLLNSK